ncbi:hypothetical protein [Streptomyces sp. NPDC020298]|uniref:hypothetical protein n=1 Tax=unclassified Streptomyces TaxID=2593676 RepID=UPI0033C0474D
MTLVIIYSLTVVASVTVGAAVAVLVAHSALRGTASEHRAAVLNAVAEVIRALCR